MAKVQYSALLEALRGSIAGTTFHRNASAEIARSRAVRARSLTPKQLPALNHSADLLTHWRSLSLGRQQQWNNFASIHKRRNIWGQELKLSGFAWHQSVNSNRLLLGLSPLDIPAPYALPTAFTELGINHVPDTLFLDPTPSTVPAGECWIGLTTPPLQRTTNISRSELRITVIYFPNQQPAFIDIAQKWSATHNLPFPPSTPHNYRLNAAIYAIRQDNGINNFGFFAIEDIYS